MLKKMDGLSTNVIGISAEGTVTRSDYESTLIPLLDAEYDSGHRIRFLYLTGPTFTGFTPGAAWDDFKVGMKYLRIFERCAIVSDVEWIRKASQAFGSFIPCPTRVFGIAELENAKTWLASPTEVSNLKFDLSDDGLLVLRPHGPLCREDFENLATKVDPWLETHDHLRGLVIATQKFPGWENFGSLVQHVSFVNSHQQKVRKIALAADGILPQLVAQLAAHFIKAEIKHFSYAEFEKAKSWAST
jgi:hypothetical protein